MSYDIGLYDRAFLRRALTSGLGDWRNADPIPETAARALVVAAEAAGFKPIGDPGHLAFLREQGKQPVDFIIDTGEYLAKLNIHRGELAFTIPYGSGRTRATIALCTSIGKAVAAEQGLAFRDPQSGETAF
jgi:hypothetical protein